MKGKGATQKNVREEIRRKAVNYLKMCEICAQYNPRPIATMTDAEIRELVSHITEDAEKSIRIREPRRGVRVMSEEESAAFAKAINDSIAYFNLREAERKRVLEYREECRRMENEQHKARIERRKKAADFIIHIKM